MITFVRVEYGYAELSASEEEWDALQAILDFALATYHKSDLDTFLPGPAEQRHLRLRQLTEAFGLLERPSDALSQDDLRILDVVVDTLENADIDGVDADLHRSITEQFTIGAPLSRVF